MKYQVEFTNQAYAEVEFAYTWIEQVSPARATEWFNGLVDIVETLYSMPGRCPVAPESVEIGREIRQLIYGKYRLLIAIEGRTIFVLHIRHGAQKHLNKDDF